METLEELKQLEYERRLEVNRLRRLAFDRPDPAGPGVQAELLAAETALSEAESRRMEAEAKAGAGVILDTSEPTTHRGLGTTGLEANIALNMAHIPTAVYHLLDGEKTPLITCEVKAAKVRPSDPEKRRVRITSFIDGYSAHAVDTFEIPNGGSHTFRQLPTLFLGQIRDLTELSRATLNVRVEDLDGKTELHVTRPVWMLARTTAPLAVQDPSTGKWQVFYDYLGAYVTPNAPALMHFLRDAASRHSEGLLKGYQGLKYTGAPEDEAKADAIVTPQVKALYDALKGAGVTYVNSTLDMNPEQGAPSQRVRLPRESLADRQANCIDGTVLCASLLEAASMSPAICVIPGHAFVAWETWRNSSRWRYLETTMIGRSSFEEAVDSGTQKADLYRSQNKLTELPLRELRVKGIFPME
jgi:hypothetical protein